MSPHDADRNALVRLFFEESQEGLATMEKALVTLEASAGHSDALKAPFRAAHTLKVNAREPRLHRDRRDDPRARNVLDCLRSGSLAVSKPVTDLLLESVDALRVVLSEAQA